MLVSIIVLAIIEQMLFVCCIYAVMKDILPEDVMKSLQQRINIPVVKLNSVASLPTYVRKLPNEILQINKKIKKKQENYEDYCI